MKTTGTGTSTAPPRLLTEADPDALIREARRRQRRRYLAIGVAIAVVLAGAAGAAVGLRGHGSRPPQRPHHAPASGQLSASTSVAAQPRFFADVITTGEANENLQIRASATGKLLAQEGSTAVNGLAATGPAGFVVAQQVGQQCAAQLYQVRLNGQGQPGAFSPVGPELHGEISSLAASEGGGLIGYAITGCGKGTQGYIGVVNTRTGQSRQWGDVSVAGESPGNVAVNGTLSMSANGRWLAFAGADTTASGSVVRQTIRVLSTTAPAGTVAERSRAVLSGLARAPMLDAVGLSPDGTSFYACTQSGSEVSVARYSTSSGALLASVARLTGNMCQLALDPSGDHLLVAYSVTATSTGSESVQVARIGAGRITSMTIRLGRGGGMDPPTGMDVAW
jgi:hypothetical protein